MFILFMKYLCSIVFVFIALIAHAQDDDYVSLNERLKSNIFLKVEASNTDCFIGEPVIVTYKLYSALHSESSIVKNPSFNGFDVKDIKSDADVTASRETVDGVVFDVHTILKMQLIPHKAGTLTLGSLVMRNNVKLVDANGNKDPLLDGVEEAYSLHNGYYNLTVTSVPLSVLVTGLPGTSGSSSSRKLVGDFKMNARLSKNVLVPEEQGTLIITILGKGDFDKIKMPEINWPEGIEVFPAKTDRDPGTSNDGSGYISFTVPFKSAKAGSYTIPSVQFSFFDATGYTYKTVTNIPLEFNVVQEGAPVPVAATPRTNTIEKINMLLIAGAIIAALLIILLLVKRHKAKKQEPVLKNTSLPKKDKQPVIAAQKNTYADDFLKPAEDGVHEEGNRFYSILKQCIIQFFESRFGLSVPLFNKESLKTLMTADNIPAGLQTDILNILTELDMNIYSGGGLNADKQRLLQKVRVLLQKL